MKETSPRYNTQKKIARISIMTTVILIASIVWMNYQKGVIKKKSTFENEPLAEVLGAIEKSFDIELVLQSSDLSACLFTGSFVDKTLEELLSDLRSTYRFDLDRVAQDKYEIRGGRCPLQQTIRK